MNHEFKLLLDGGNNEATNNANIYSQCLLATKAALDLRNHL
jgi:hypothetical protein